VRCDRCWTEVRSSRLSDCGLHWQWVPDVIAKVSDCQGFTGTYWFQLQRRGAERIGIWDQSSQQSCPWPVTFPTGRVTDGDRSSTRHPTANVLLQDTYSHILAADTHLRCLRQNGEQPPPSTIEITGKNLATSLIHVACPNAACDLMYRAIKLCSRPVCFCKR
jgi:hypothetical protein